VVARILDPRWLTITLIAVIALVFFATAMYIAMLYIGTTLTVSPYLSCRSHLINLLARRFSVTRSSDPETYENGVDSKCYDIRENSYFFKIS